MRFQDDVTALAQAAFPWKLSLGRKILWLFAETVSIRRLTGESAVRLKCVVNVHARVVKIFAAGKS